MRRKYIPAFVMLLAGAVVSIVEIVTKMDVLKSLKILLAVLIIFYIIGCIAKIVVIKVLDGNSDENEDEYLTDEESKTGSLDQDTVAEATGDLSDESEGGAETLHHEETENSVDEG